MKKGQAAMEFLMTYGWAILVVLIAIGALAYFGVLSPDKLLPNQCRLAQGLYCKSHKADTAGVSVLIVNSLGKDITVTGINITDQSGCDASFSTALANDQQAQFDVACTITAGTKIKSDIAVTYDETGGLSGLKNSGNFIAQVE